MSRKKIHKVKVSKIKIRKTWIRHPGQKIIDNKRKQSSRELEKEVRAEYENTNL